MNKLGNEKVMALWWFFVIVIISVGIIGGLLIYYNTEVDIREFESRILSDKIYSCIIENGYLVEENLKEDNIFSKCKINKNLFEEGSQYYIKIRVEDIKGNLVGEEKNYGQRSFEKDCLISNKVNVLKFPRCTIKRVVSLLDKGEIVFIEIISASNQKGRKINF